jgi:hypothetical protein
VVFFSGPELELKPRKGASSPTLQELIPVVRRRSLRADLTPHTTDPPSDHNNSSILPNHLNNSQIQIWEEKLQRPRSRRARTHSSLRSLLDNGSQTFTRTGLAPSTVAGSMNTITFERRHPKLCNCSNC